MLGVDVGILDDDDDKKAAQHVTFRCPPELHARLEQISASTGKKRSKVIVRLLTFALRELDKEQAETSRRSRK